MRCVVLCLLALPLLSCRHEFPPTSPGDLEDHDPDGAIAADQRAAGDQRVLDRLLADATLPACTPVTGPGADCAKEESWSCVGVCDGQHRYACTKSPVAREIRCPGSGPCECLVDGKPAGACPGLDNGRLGCDRCLEALRQGCCRP